MLPYNENAEKGRNTQQSYTVQHFYIFNILHPFQKHFSDICLFDSIIVWQKERNLFSLKMSEKLFSAHIYVCSQMNYNM